MVGQSRFICLRSNLLQVKMFLNDRNWNNSIQILLHYKHVPSIMDWESVVVNCGKYQLLARMPKSREILLLSNLILATWYLILLDLQKIPTSSHRSLYNCTSDPSVSNVTRLEGAIREAAGRQGHLNAKGPRMLAASWKKISFAGKEILKYWNTMVLVLVIVAHTWSIYESSVTSHLYTQVNGNKSMSHLDVP